MDITFVGFDSAWTDKPSSPGAICAVTYEAGQVTRFVPPGLASYAEALAFTRSVQGVGPTLVAIDPPWARTPGGARFRVRRRLGGGVANRDKSGIRRRGPELAVFYSPERHRGPYNGA